jgi:hypothetical protein
MATLVYKEGQNLNFAISAEVIEAMIRSGLARTKPFPSQTPSPTPDGYAFAKLTGDSEQPQPYP